MFVHETYHRLLEVRHEVSHNQMKPHQIRNRCSLVFHIRHNRINCGVFDRIITDLF